MNSYIRKDTFSRTLLVQISTFSLALAYQASALPFSRSNTEKYAIPKDLEKIAQEYDIKVALPDGVSIRDFLVFADVIATERAGLLKRNKLTEDYEFALAVGCIPIPNWPKDPPPPPPPPEKRERIRQALRVLMKGIDEDEDMQIGVRKRLDKEILILSRQEFRERKLVVSDVLGDLESLVGTASSLQE